MGALQWLYELLVPQNPRIRVLPERVCREHGRTKVMLLSGMHRTEAHAFFERLGYDGSVSRAFKKYLPR